MKALIQRVSHANVVVENTTLGQIDQGLVVLAGIDKHDTQESILRMTKKLLAYRVFADAEGKMNLNVRDIDGGLLLISQFTLSANTKKGLRPSFSSAAPPQQAAQLFNYFVDTMNLEHNKIETGLFGGDMKVSLCNDGPVTFMLET